MSVRFSQLDKPNDVSELNPLNGERSVRFGHPDKLNQVSAFNPLIGEKSLTVTA
jgi:hypothetical protein